MKYGIYWQVLQQIEVTGWDIAKDSDIETLNITFKNPYKYKNIPIIYE